MVISKHCELVAKNNTEAAIVNVNEELKIFSASR